MKWIVQGWIQLCSLAMSDGETSLQNNAVGSGGFGVPSSQLMKSLLDRNWITTWTPCNQSLVKDSCWQHHVWNSLHACSPYMDQRGLGWIQLRRSNDVILRAYGYFQTFNWQSLMADYIKYMWLTTGCRVSNFSGLHHWCYCLRIWN